MEVIYSKVESIKRCLSRVREEFNGSAQSLDNITKQDAIVLNIQRACEMSIDLANHLISSFQFGIPSGSRDSMEILLDNQVISQDLSDRLKRMIGFRNIAIHEYRKISKEILVSIIENNMADFESFIEAVLKYKQKEE